MRDAGSFLCTEVHILNFRCNMRHALCAPPRSLVPCGQRLFEHADPLFNVTAFPVPHLQVRSAGCSTRIYLLRSSSAILSPFKRISWNAVRSFLISRQGEAARTTLSGFSRSPWLFVRTIASNFPCPKLTTLFALFASFLALFRLSQHHTYYLPQAACSL